MSNLYQKTFSEFENTELVVANSLAQVNTIMPCSVTSVQYPKITVKPLIKRIFINQNNENEYIPYTDISDIPILTLGNNEFNISFPLPKAGDRGLLFACQNQVSDVYETGEIDTPRKFSLTDSVFVPLFMSKEAPVSDTMTVNAEKINIKSDKFSVTNSTAELTQSLVAALNAINNLVTNLGDTINPASKAAIQAEIDKIQSFI